MDKENSSYEVLVSDNLSMANKSNEKLSYDDTPVSRKGEIFKFPPIYPNEYRDNNLDDEIKKYKKNLNKSLNDKKNSNDIKNSKKEQDTKKIKTNLTDNKNEEQKESVKKDKEIINNISDINNETKNIHKTEQNKNKKSREKKSKNKAYKIIKNNEFEKSKDKKQDNYEVEKLKDSIIKQEDFIKDKENLTKKLSQNKKVDNKIENISNKADINKNKLSQNETINLQKNEIKTEENTNLLKTAKNTKNEINKNIATNSKIEEEKTIIQESNKNGKLVENKDSKNKNKLLQENDENKIQVKKPLDDLKDNKEPSKIEYSEIIEKEIKEREEIKDNLKENKKEEVSIDATKNEANNTIEAIEKKIEDSKEKIKELDKEINVKDSNKLNLFKIDYFKYLKNKNKEKKVVKKNKASKNNNKTKESSLEEKKVKAKPNIKMTTKTSGDNKKSEEEKKSENKEKVVNKVIDVCSSEKTLVSDEKKTIKKKEPLSFGNDKIFNVLIVLVVVLFVFNIVLSSILIYSIRNGGTKNLDYYNNNITIVGDGITSQAVHRARQSTVAIAAGGVANDEASFYNNTVNRGTGVIYKIDRVENCAYIITCEHVISGYENAIYILFSTYLKPIKVYVVGYSVDYDIAVLKVKDLSNIDGFYSIESYNSQYLAMGESVFTIGNSLSGGLSASSGLISYINKLVMLDNGVNREIQTDLTINPGNSGGGLFNNEGKFIGLINSKLSTTKSDDSYINVEGVSYAIPGLLVINIVENILKNNGVLKYMDIGVTFKHQDRYVSYTEINGKQIEKFEVRVSSISNKSCFSGILNVDDIILSFKYTDLDGVSHEIKMLNEYCFDDIKFDILSGSTVEFYINRPLFNEFKTVSVVVTNEVIQK